MKENVFSTELQLITKTIEILQTFSKSQETSVFLF